MKTTSVKLSEEAARALAWLRDQTGGWNLNKAINQLIVTAAKLKGWVAVLAVVLIAGCGSGGGNPDTPTATAGVTPPASFTHKTTLDKLPPEYLAQYNETVACVDSYYQAHPGITYHGPDGEPEFIITTEPIPLPDGKTHGGATDFATHEISLMVPNGDMTYPIRSKTVAHEATHWRTGLGDDHHGDDVFKTCGEVQLNI